VLTLSGPKQGAKNIPNDNGINGLWQQLQKLTTTASILHTQAHPDDEQAELVTYLGRGTGTRTALLSLNRGESGGNVLGEEFFDRLGLLRTEEFLLAASYYGLDDLYFTKLVDYGFSKRVEEAYGKWDRQKVLGEIVRVIRINRPLVIISRFHGSTRDGHGNHQAAGELSQEAFTLAGDPTAFAEQISKEGLRPWKALKMYRGGVRAEEDWTLQLNTGMYSPWLGDSYRNFAMLGYSFHRSQFGGQRRQNFGPFVQQYQRMHSLVPAATKERGFFEGMDTTLIGIYTLTGEKMPAGMKELLTAISSDVNSAMAELQVQKAGLILPKLTSGLQKTRQAIALAASTPDALFLLQVKEQQFIHAINTSAGVMVQAIGVPSNTPDIRGPYEPLPTMGFAVAGRPFKIETVLLNANGDLLEPQSLEIIAPPGTKVETTAQPRKVLLKNDKVQQNFMVTLTEDVANTQPYFSRKSLNESVYALEDGDYENLPMAPAPLQVKATFTINNVSLSLQVPVQVRQANLPYGYNEFALKVAPAIAVNLQPSVGIVPAGNTPKKILLRAEVVNNLDTATTGVLSISTPAGWKTVPATVPFRFSKAGEKSSYVIEVLVPPVSQKTFTIQAVASVGGKRYTKGYAVIAHRDNDQMLLYTNATTAISAINVKVPSGIRVGYIMGVGDNVPAGLQQLGASVQLLTAADLATATLQQFDVIMVGTRAYAVRKDLLTYNQRLLDYANKGGHLIVLFQTPEFNPTTMAPLPASLPGNTEEVSEEDSPVQILAPAHRVLNYPNTITAADFEHWVEQRGSKFFATWDKAYVPIIATWDAGQAPQSGGWLMAPYGKGHYTYCAYSFHRQLPSAVSGAFRIMANLIAYGVKQ